MYCVIREFSGQSYQAFTLVNYDSRVVNMGYFQVRYNSRVVIYERKMFIRLATALTVRSSEFESCGQSYKALMIIIYDSRVVPDLKLPHITTLES